MMAARIEEKPPLKELSIWVHTLSGHKYHIDVTKDETLHDLKEFMDITFKIPQKQQRYIYRSTLMTCDTKTFAEYGIKVDEILHMVLKLRGGAKTKQYNPPPLPRPPVKYRHWRHGDLELEDDFPINEEFKKFLRLPQPIFYERAGVQKRQRRL